jgi:hypothetical protein
LCTRPRPGPAGIWTEIRRSAEIYPSFRDSFSSAERRSSAENRTAGPLVRQSARYSTVTLAPGRTAHFNLIYLTGVPGDGVNITVHKIVITPPGDRSHAVLSWNQSVLLQDAAT